MPRAQRDRLAAVNIAVRTRPEYMRQLVGDGSVLDLADVLAAYITEGKKP